MNQSPLCCPVCQELLLQEGCTYRCANNHCFDLAKEGYINLLLSHQRKSKNPGDDKAMIQARRRFFDSGAFDPVTQLISKSTTETKSSWAPRMRGNEVAIGNRNLAILDCGCGEGHFLNALTGERYGVDLSKEAIRCAAKRYQDVTWIVANGMRALPFADHSMDCILSVLAPRNPEEFSRILKPGGVLLLGVPGPNHLIELRTLLHANADRFEEKADEAAAKCAPLFTETNRDALSYTVSLNREQIADLIQMTPIFWNSSPEAKEKVRQLDDLETTVSLVLLALEP